MRENSRISSGGFGKHLRHRFSRRGASAFDNSHCAWLIGFFYIAAKRFLIKRVAYYLRTRIATPELKLSWQTWLRAPEADHDAKQHFLHFHPFKLEYSLLLFISIVNSTWLCVIFLRRPVYAGWDFLVAIIGLIELLLALLAGLIVVRKYYRHTSRT